jgi:hypothetical protein
MTSDQLLREIEALPDDDRRQVADFIAFLRFRAKRRRPERPRKRAPLSHEPFVGIWSDREDMADSVAWVRSLREREWRP